MKKYLLFLILFGFQNSYSQKAVSISGTKYSIVPPEGFSTASNFSGFQNVEKGSSIMITELPNSYFKMSDAFTPEALKTKGMILKSKEEINFKGEKATYFKVSQQANGMTYLKQILMFGDDNKTVMVNGIYPEKFNSIENQIKVALLSTTFNEEQNDNPLDAVKFSVKVSETSYEFVKYLSGSLLYSEDGKFPSNKGIFMVSPSIGKFPESNRKQYSIDRLKKLPNGENNKVKAINPITINNLSGYEIVADGKNTDSEDEIVYLVMLYNDSEYFIMVGQATNDQQKNLEAFKKIANSFELK